MATGVYKRTKEMKTGKHMTGRVPWNKGLKGLFTTRVYKKTWTQERQKEYARKWAQDKRDSSPEYRKKQSAKTREYQKNNPLKNAWVQYRTSARVRNLEFKLDKDVFNLIISDNCIYCGHNPSPINGIDRVDNTKGYLVGNCVPCCVICNKAKASLTLEEFKNWVDKIYNKLFN